MSQEHINSVKIAISSLNSIGDQVLKTMVFTIGSFPKSDWGEEVPKVFKTHGRIVTISSVDKKLTVSFEDGLNINLEW